MGSRGTVGKRERIGDSPATSDGGDRSGRRVRWSRAERIAAVAAAATVCGVVVALLTWLLPSGVPTDSGGARGADSVAAGGGSPAAAPTGSATQPTNTQPGSGGSQRYLADLIPVEGAGVVSSLPPHGFAVQCGTNQSDDKLREVVYDLPGNYRQVAVDATPMGKADPESLTEISIYAHDRYDRADRERQVALRTVTLGTTVRLAAEITGARTLTIRVRCRSPAVSVRFSDARIMR